LEFDHTTLSPLGEHSLKEQYIFLVILENRWLATTYLYAILALLLFVAVKDEYK
jgi:hypothetical protein